MDIDLLTTYVRHGVMSVHEARAELDLIPCSFGDWPLNLPPAPVAKAQPRCSYCRFLAEGSRCGNCGAPQ